MPATSAGVIEGRSGRQVSRRVVAVVRPAFSADGRRPTALVRRGALIPRDGLWASGRRLGQIGTDRPGGVGHRRGWSSDTPERAASGAGSRWHERRRRSPQPSGRHPGDLQVGWIAAQDGAELFEGAGRIVRLDERCCQGEPRHNIVRGLPDQCSGLLKSPLALRVHRHRCPPLRWLSPGQSSILLRAGLSRGRQCVGNRARIGWTQTGGCAVQDIAEAPEPRAMTSIGNDSLACIVRA